ncbi:hypothetical protein ACF0H5_010394 [Mactra antiquata]
MSVEIFFDIFIPILVELTMASVDHEFTNDIDACLTIATRLSKLDTDESKTFVAEQLRILSDFIQKKQKDAEARIDEEIAEEEKEIETLKSRIKNASDDADGSTDIETIDHLKMWNTLEEIYWKDAFDVYISDTKEPVKAILDNLMNMLKTSFRVCKEKARKCRDDIIFQILQPGNERPTQKETKGTDQNLIDLCTKCQADCMPFCLESAKKEIVEEVRRQSELKALFATKLQELNRTLNLYLEKCVEFCWVACFQEPKILIVSEPNKECKHIAHQFQNNDKVTHAVYKTHVEWPALVQGDNVKVPWVLYDLDNKRPEPNSKQKEIGTKFRAVTTEDSHGNEIKDEEENIRMSKSSKTFAGPNSVQKLSTATAGGSTVTSGKNNTAPKGKGKTNSSSTGQAKSSSVQNPKIAKHNTSNPGNKEVMVKKTPETNLNRRQQKNYQPNKGSKSSPNMDF